MPDPDPRLRSKRGNVPAAQPAARPLAGFPHQWTLRAATVREPCLARASPGACVDLTQAIGALGTFHDCRATQETRPADLMVSLHLLRDATDQAGPGGPPPRAKPAYVADRVKRRHPPIFFRSEACFCRSTGNNRNGQLNRPRAAGHQPILGADRPLKRQLRSGQRPTFGQSRVSLSISRRPERRSGNGRPRISIVVSRDVDIHCLARRRINGTFNRVGRGAA